MSEVKSLRLVNGEILLGLVTEHDDGSVTIDKPASIQLQMVQPGQLGVAMIPYNPWLSEPPLFWRSALMGPPTPVDDNTTNSYNERFNDSGIIKPPSGLLLG